MKHFETLQTKYPNWLFMSIVGSQNYGTATPESDTDIKVAYLPTFDEYFHNKFTHVDKAGPDQEVDYTVHPVNEFLKHAFKGNMNFWEVFFADTFEMNVGDTTLNRGHVISTFVGGCQDIVRMNYLANYNAMMGMAIHKHKIVKIINDSLKLVRYLENSDMSKRAWKEAQHAMRVLETLHIYIMNDELVLNLVNTVKPFEWSEWKDRGYFGPRSFKYVNELFETKLGNIKNLECGILAKEAEEVKCGLRQSMIDSTYEIVKDMVLGYEL